MCGLNVIIKFVDVSCPASVLGRMGQEVAYRGPDDQGMAFFRNKKVLFTDSPSTGSCWEVGLGHRRLSILDLSQAGHQPMVYRNRFWIVYNGEVYNFIELREELKGLGHVFRSSSDTEVILAAYAEWGPSCFRKFRGMWGLVIFDYAKREVILSRDRLGIKPLYVWQRADLIAVVSEIKQFRHLPWFAARLDPNTAAEYLQTGYEDPGRSFFRDVKPLQAGSWVKIPLDTLKISPPEKYWDPEKIQVTRVSPEEAGRLFLDKLQEGIRIHLRSDVPVGCALSGGLDSSSIAVLVNDVKPCLSGPFHTFTSTFPGDKTDECEYVNAVLQKINAEPHFVTPDQQIFLSEMDRFLWIHDEPVGSFAVYAGYCVARLTRKFGIPVTLNGQGGDEIFSGYWQSYFLYLWELLRRGRLTILAGHFAGALTGGGNASLWEQVPVMLRRFVERRNPSPYIQFRNPTFKRASDILGSIVGLGGQNRRLFEIRAMFLPRLLKWEDRNSMAFSVEGRYPLLDHELIELCLSFPPDVLYNRGWTKWPLRIGLKSVLPQEISQRRSKFGFEVPQTKWLCSSLRPTLESWLRQDSPVWDLIEREGVRNLAKQVWRRKGNQEESGQALFRIFIFDRWLQLYGISG